MHQYNRKIGLFFGYAPPEKGAPIARLTSLANYLCSEPNFEPVAFVPKKQGVQYEKRGRWKIVDYASNEDLAKKVRELSLAGAIVSTPPLDVAYWAQDLLQRLRIPTIADFRDPSFHCWCKVWSKKGMPNRWLRALKFYIKERRLLSRAVAATVVSPSLREQLNRTFPFVNTSILLAENGADPDLFHRLSEQQISMERRSLGIPASAPVLIYSGTICPEFQVTSFIRTCGPIIDKAGGYCIILAVYDKNGEGHRLDIENTINACNLSGTFCLKSNLPVREVTRYMNVADYGITSVQSGLAYSIQIKVYEYILSGIPVLAKGDPGGGLSRLFAEYPSIGRFYVSWEALKDDFADAIKHRLQVKENLLENYEYYRMRFSRQKANKTFADLIESAARSKC